MDGEFVFIVALVIVAGFLLIKLGTQEDNKSSSGATAYSQARQTTHTISKATEAIPDTIGSCIACGNAVAIADSLRLNDGCYLHRDCYDRCLDGSTEHDKIIIQHAHDWWPGGQVPDWDLRRRAALEKAGYKCEQCGKTGVSLYVHHLVPLAKHGSNLPNNLQAVCWDCHQLEHTDHDIKNDFHASYSDKLALVEKALETNRRIQIHYSDAKGKETDRILHPKKIEYVNYKYQLQAYCELVGKVWRFNIEQMSNIRIID